MATGEIGEQEGGDGENGILKDVLVARASPREGMVPGRPGDTLYIRKRRKAKEVGVRVLGRKKTLKKYFIKQPIIDELPRKGHERRK